MLNHLSYPILIYDLYAIIHTNHIWYSYCDMELYLKSNIRFYDAKDIPHFNEKSPDGVFNAEYDCNLETTTYLSQEKFAEWIMEDNNV